MPGRTLSDSEAIIEAYGDFLYRFALLRVRNRDVAEDLVQDTFLAALQGSYHGNRDSAERRWIIGIMKHKIVDYYRRVSREPIRNPDQPDGRSVEEDFLPDGHWRPDPAAVQTWPERPDGLIERRQFWDALARCMERLPPRAAQVFTLRELDALDTEKISDLLHLTPTNVGVILHRTRKQLRDCLATHYFGRTQEDVAP